jgi:Ca2+-binding RTX toxin-like protein
VAGLQEQYTSITSDNRNITANSPNWFIHTGAGNDAVAVTSGTNVVDGGTGSNFLTSGSGTDTFFVDDRSPAADIWSTVNHVHAGDAAIVWGITPQDFDLTWVDGQGASGYTGLTLHATAAGEPTASLTLVGYTQADLSSGCLSGPSAQWTATTTCTYMRIAEDDPHYAIRGRQ